MPEVTAHQLDLLQHTLGLAANSRTASRNYFLDDQASTDRPHFQGLMDAGLMTSGPAPSWVCGDIVYRATAAGKSYAVEHLAPAPPAPKWTKYDAYLDADNCDSFAEFLLGWGVPKFERDHLFRGGRYRMYREKWQEYLGAYRDVQGEWCATKKDAKASYKAALRASRPSSAASPI